MPACVFALAGSRASFGTILEPDESPSTHGSPLMAAPKPAKFQPPPFQLSLRIRHPCMDPKHISDELGIEPEYSFRAGQPRHSKSGLAPAAVHTESYWLAPLSSVSWFGNPSFTEPLNLSTTQGHIDATIARDLTGALSLQAVRLNKSQGMLLQKIRSEGGDISLLVTLSPAAVTNFSLPPQISRLYSESGITLEFEITDD